MAYSCWGTRELPKCPKGRPRPLLRLQDFSPRAVGDFGASDNWDVLKDKSVELEFGTGERELGPGLGFSPVTFIIFCL